MSSHDSLWKSLLKAFLAEFIQLVVPEVLHSHQVEKADFLEQETLSDPPHGELSQLDVLARVPVSVGTGAPPDDAAETGILLIHVEVERQFRQTMDRRMWRYYRQLRLKHQEPVIPIVLFLRGGPKGVKNRTVREAVAGFEITHFTYWAFGLSGAEAESYLGRNALTPALASCMRSRLWRPAEKKLRCLETILDLETDAARKFLLVNAVETYIDLAEEQTMDYAELVAMSNQTQEIKMMELTWAGKLELKGREIGRSEGLDEGRAEGRTEGLRQMLEMQLTERFGSLSGASKRQLQAINDLETLESLGKKLLSAKSLEELGLG